MNKFHFGRLMPTLKAIKPVLKVVAKKSQTLFSSKYLLYTNTGVSIILSGAGDVVQQNYQRMKKNLKVWDVTRTAHVSCTGLAVGPLFHYWYLYLDKWLPGKTVKTVAKKIVVDQLICSPLYIAIFLVTICLMEKAPWSSIKSDLIEKGTTLYKADCLIWPPAQLINFMFLPTKYRVLYDNTIAFGFDCYFSHVRYDKEYCTTTGEPPSKNIVLNENDQLKQSESKMSAYFEYHSVFS